MNQQNRTDGRRGAILDKNVQSSMTAQNKRSMHVSYDLRRRQRHAYLRIIDIPPEYLAALIRYREEM